jgi:hypothetical protein
MSSITPEDSDGTPSDAAGLGGGADQYAGLGKELNVGPPPSPEAQHDALLAMQEHQAQVLRASGILETAQAKLGSDAEHPTMKPIVSTSEYLTESGESLLTASVQFQFTETAKSGDLQHRFRYSDVARHSDGLTLPLEGYSSEQADTIMSLVDDLKKAKEDNILPQLSVHLDEFGGI